MSEIDVEKASAEHRATKLALSQLEAEVEAKAKAAAEAVKDLYAEQVRAARQARQDAHVALNAAITATAQHPWEGRRVFRLETRGAAYQRLEPTRLEGVVEVRRNGTVFPANAGTYSLPEMGAAFVRLLKKDGAPGTKFECLIENAWRPWKLVDEEATPSS